MSPDEIQQAQTLMSNGELQALYDLLRPFIEQNEPNALLFYSSFTLDDWNESDEVFMQRSFSNLQQASKAGLAEASYQLAAHYLYGEDTFDLQQATHYFENAIEQHHPLAEFTYGYSLYYGLNGLTADQERGLRLLKSASSQGVEGADDVLADIKAS
ncbi:tetratricopeptide repeat protein [Pleionea sp. CnH1-48]|uniref:tetratricopeptide repeat protein n=1 Tax=Pleionea sp. CnH1-48 TaxID=2954494 RepID=UPI0020977115|nr:hypothetical protein [Pleionea sp. CnH1-48]MCO7226013.1 hypothetical protein [Pleionea sp. CnH1-48]